MNPAAVAPRLETGSTRHHSLALELVLGRLQRERASRLLDLGSAVGANVTFLSRFRCKLYIADLYRTLRAARSPATGGDPAALEALLARQLPDPADGGFQFFFAWDLLNYLDRQEVAVLGRQLRRLARPRTLFFAMVSTRQQIPQGPLRFHIADQETLLYENRSTVARPSPQYKEAELRRLLPGFEVETTFLLRNGMQEYLFAPRTAQAPDGA